MRWPGDELPVGRENGGVVAHGRTFEQKGEIAPARRAPAPAPYIRRATLAPPATALRSSAISILRWLRILVRVKCRSLHGQKERRLAAGPDQRIERALRGMERSEAVEKQLHFKAVARALRQRLDDGAADGIGVRMKLAIWMRLSAPSINSMNLL